MSSYSNQDRGECIEVSDDQATVVPVRDSKTPLGPVLMSPAEGWTTFIKALQKGQLSN
ncbi:DUF397 domain-containing protein [Streptomyces sp. NBC_01224]|uniref:DUF397 domain-containing protein n=1 Tax=Streptomyces sp. NBC_01224 TaxID=2903783 RepID=UPI002E1085B5|nr:DUF397 domain-containing protein [Streptomyces sp. NBC_01224]